MVWQNIDTGVYQFTAVSTDDDGASTESAVVEITVTGSSPGACAALLDYPAGIGTYTYGQQVQNNGNLYEVKPFPYGGWANINAPYYYEPGTGIAWENAWLYVGSCD